MIPQRSLPSPACILCVNTRTKGQGRLPDLWDPIQSENAGRKVQLKTMAQERGADTLFFVLFLSCWQGAEPRPFHLIKGSNTEFSSSSKNLDEGLAKIFDEILLQVFSNVPFDETRRTAGQSITTSDMKERASVAAGNSAEPEFFLGSMDRISSNDHISEAERDDEPPLFNRAVSEQLTTADKKTLQEAVSPGIRNGNLPCAQLLHFLQRNIIIAAVSVAGILVVTVVVLLGLTACMRRKQCLSPPANMTYNIFIMNGKSLWQKSQEKSPTKHAGKQKQLKCNSCV
nr:uncharacterized protein C2orf92 homolog isoform X5 [Equus asinus]